MFTNVSRPSAVDVLQPFVVGDLFQADSTSTLARLPDVAVGNVLLSGGVGALAAYGKVDVVSHVTGVLPAINGGTGVANNGTITNASNTTITGGGTLALGGYTLTVPATGTAALLGASNAFTGNNTMAGTLELTTASNGLTLSKATGTTLTVSSTDAAAIDCAGGISADGGVGIGAVQSAATPISIAASIAGNLAISVQNTSSAAGAGAGLQVVNDTAISVTFGVNGSAYGSYGIFANNSAIVYCNSSAGLALMADNAAGVIKFAAGGNAECARITTSGILLPVTTGTTLTVSSTDGASFQTEGGIAIKDGITAPSATAGYAKIYVDTSDGDLKVIFGDGTVKTIVTDT